MMFLPLSEKVVLGLMSGPIRSGESSMMSLLLFNPRCSSLFTLFFFSLFQMSIDEGSPIFGLYITTVSHEVVLFNCMFLILIPGRVLILCEIRGWILEWEERNHR